MMQVRTLDKPLRLEFHADGPLPQSVETDPTRLRQIVLNLVSNAVKFTKQGSVTLRLRYETSEVSEDFGSLSSVGRLVFEVSDTGIGMTPDQMNRLFRPFTQADTSTTRQYGGTGLGLTICKRFAEMMDGDISATSTPGQGSTFTLVLPARGAQDITTSGPLPEVAAAVRAAPSLFEPLSCRILLVDDGPDNQKLLSFLLQRKPERK